MPHLLLSQGSIVHGDFSHSSRQLDDFLPVSSRPFVRAYPADSKCRVAGLRFAVRKQCKVKVPDPEKPNAKVWVQVGKFNRDGVAFQVCFQRLPHEEVRRMIAASGHQVRDGLVMWNIVDVAVSVPASTLPFQMVAAQNSNSEVSSGRSSGGAVGGGGQERAPSPGKLSKKKGGGKKSRGRG